MERESENDEEDKSREKIKTVESEMSSDSECVCEPTIILKTIPF